MYTECSTCGFVVHAEGFVAEKSFFDAKSWPEGLPCVDPACRGYASVVPARTADRRLSFGAYFRALHGFGVGETELARPDKVADLLLSKKVVHVDVEPVGQPIRTLIKSIKFDNGTTLRFATSNKGACVYMIEEAPRADSRLAAEPDSKNRAADRTQSGYPGGPNLKGPSRTEVVHTTDVRGPDD